MYLNEVTVVSVGWESPTRLIMAYIMDNNVLEETPCIDETSIDLFEQAADAVYGCAIQIKSVVSSMH